MRAKKMRRIQQLKDVFKVGKMKGKWSTEQYWKS